MTPLDGERRYPAHEYWQDIAEDRARTIDTLQRRVGHWMKRCERAEAEVMRLLRERKPE